MARCLCTSPCESVQSGGVPRFRHTLPLTRKELWAGSWFDSSCRGHVYVRCLNRRCIFFGYPFQVGSKQDPACLGAREDLTLRAVAGKHAADFVPERLPWQNLGKDRSVGLNAPRVKSVFLSLQAASPPQKSTGKVISFFLVLVSIYQGSILGLPYFLTAVERQC